MEIKILESAKHDLREGFWFYEQQATGLGDYFLESVHRRISELHDFAGIHEKVDGLHRMLVVRFPYVVYYDIADDAIRIFAIVDGRRDPRWTTRRVRQAKEERETDS